MSKNRAGLYAALAAAGAGGYYLYRAGGDPKGAKEEMKHDVDVARSKAPGPGQAEQKAQKYGSEAGAQIDEAVANARSKANDLNKQASGLAQDGLNKLDDASSKVRSEVDKMDHKVEQKASEAKGTVSGWFGGNK